MTKKIDTTERLILAFLELCHSIGVQNITLQKVAKQAQVAFGTAHYHFGSSPDALTLAAVRYVGAQAQSYIENYLQDPKHLTPQQNPLHAYVRGTFQWARSFTHYSSFWVYYYHLSITHPELHQIQEQVIQTAQQRLLRLIYESIGKGLYTATDDLEKRAQQIHSFILGSTLLGITLPGIFSETQEKNCIQGIDVLLNS